MARRDITHTLEDFHKGSSDYPHSPYSGRLNTPRKERERLLRISLRGLTIIGPIGTLVNEINKIVERKDEKADKEATNKKRLDALHSNCDTLRPVMVIGGEQMYRVIQQQSDELITIRYQRFLPERLETLSEGESIPRNIVPEYLGLPQSKVILLIKSGKLPTGTRISLRVVNDYKTELQEACQKH